MQKSKKVFNDKKLCKRQKVSNQWNLYKKSLLKKNPFFYNEKRDIGIVEQKLIIKKLIEVPQQI